MNVSVRPGANVTALVNVEIYDPAGRKVYQKAWDSQTLRSGRTTSFSTAWSIPASAAKGTYTVKIGVFQPGWGVLYHWNNAAASFSIR